MAAPINIYSSERPSDPAYPLEAYPGPRFFIFFLQHLPYANDVRPNAKSMGFLVL